MDRRPHPVHPELEVNRNGVVFDVRLKRERKLNQQDNLFYVLIKLKTGKKLYYPVARFVYEAFYGLLKEDLQVYHLDGNVINRSLANLTSMTADERKNQIAEALQSKLDGRRHPKLTDFIGFPDGKVYNLYKEKFLEGYKNDAGYVRFNKIEGHKLIFECFNGVVNGKLYHIDHINNVHDDNRLINLQKLTRREHLIKTMTIDRPLARKKLGIALSKPLIRIKKDRFGNILEQVSFESVHQAIAVTMKEHPEITIMTADSLTPRTNTSESYKGFFWRYQEPVDLPGEVWKPVPLDGVHLRVSSAGRVEFKNGRRTFGGARRANYLTIEHQKKSYPVHFLVCAAFHKHPSTLDDKTITPDHINHIVDDNRADNLKWATAREQVVSRRCMRLIIAIDKSNDTEIGSFETIDDARIAFGVGKDVVLKSLNGTAKCSRRLPNIRFEWRQKT